MQIGQIVDFIIDYNNRNKTDEDKKEQTSKMHIATQKEIDAYFG